MADNKLQPIIIKRIKKGKHAAHGGAWKIAYADFVTAMMAFFLLMWLLGSTAQGELQGIAEYFNAPLQVAMAGGNGADHRGGCAHRQVRLHLGHGQPDRTVAHDLHHQGTIELDVRLHEDRRRRHLTQQGTHRCGVGAGIDVGRPAL